MSDLSRTKVERDIAFKLKTLKGFGGSRASQAASAVMEVLDHLVEEFNGEENSYEYDEDGIRWMKRPDYIEAKWQYLIWSPRSELMWLETDKPSMGLRTMDHWHRAKGEELTLLPIDYNPLWDSLPKTSTREERVIRFYDG